eukprot:TRINITY_DN8048_c0_g1_i1.p1 TRINITY_DN8048_c0_g1~~TRINITY_DN8048_c0_g1_i1.p1  ORF type:complete len:327 (+),score=46.54 TRINITY_DN8048_c0_g1_i1:124-1104(+)
MSTTKRKPYTHLACQNCKSKHLKCDGQRPLCGSCTSKGISCVYRDERNRKREAPGKIEESYREYATALVAQKNKWKAKYYALKALYDPANQLHSIGDLDSEDEEVPLFKKMKLSKRPRDRKISQRRWTIGDSDPEHDPQYRKHLKNVASSAGSPMSLDYASAGSAESPEFNNVPHSWIPPVHQQKLSSAPNPRMFKLSQESSISGRSFLRAPPGAFRHQQQQNVSRSRSYSLDGRTRSTHVSTFDDIDTTFSHVPSPPTDSIPALYNLNSPPVQFPPQQFPIKSEFPIKQEPLFMPSDQLEFSHVEPLNQFSGVPDHSLIDNQDWL